MSPFLALIPGTIQFRFTEAGISYLVKDFLSHTQRVRGVRREHKGPDVCGKVLEVKTDWKIQDMIYAILMRERNDRNKKNTNDLL